MIKSKTKTLKMKKATSSMANKKSGKSKGKLKGVATYK